MTVAEDAPDVAGWVTGIASGDRAAEVALAEHFAPRVRAMLRGRLRQAEAVQELTLAALASVVLALRLRELPEAERLPAFVHDVTRSVVLDHLRGGVRRDHRPLEESVAARLAGAAPVADEARRTLIARGLAAMAPADREVLQLALVDGLEPRQIAERLSLSAEAVRQRKRRAVIRLIGVVDAGTAPAG